jgi:hypothetical protein
VAEIFDHATTTERDFFFSIYSFYILYYLMGVKFSPAIFFLAQTEVFVTLRAVELRSGAPIRPRLLQIATRLALLVCLKSAQPALPDLANGWYMFSHKPVRWKRKTFVDVWGPGSRSWLLGCFQMRALENELPGHLPIKILMTDPRMWCSFLQRVSESQ